jgi:hypothetical protein
VLSRFRDSKPPIRHSLTRCLGSAFRTENHSKTKASKVHPCATQGAQMEPNLVPLVSKMVPKMAPKPYPGHLRTRSKKKHIFFMIVRPAGTLKIIKSVELSSISRFSHYARTTSKCHSPGSLLGHFSGPPGIKKVPCTCYKTFPKSCLSQSGPRASKGSRSFKKWSPKGDPKSLKNRF